MRSNSPSNNIFFSNSSANDSSRSSRFFPSLKESQYFDQTGNFCQSPSRHSNQVIYCDKKISTFQSNQKNSVVFDSQINVKQSLYLERARSQVINSVYFSPLKSNLKADLEQSCQLGTSKVSQITFSKPSQFITNTLKQNVYLDISKQNVNDYGYKLINFHSINPSIKQSFLKGNNLGKQQCFLETFNPYRSNIVNTSSQVIPKFQQKIQSSIIRSNILSPKRISGMQIFKNPSSAGFVIRPEIHRCLSNRSFISENSKSNSSQTKIKFTYMSPSKSENKIGRKLSFKKEDVRNPLSKLKLSRKKSQEKTKIQFGSSGPKTISEVVNQYFPESKIKRNKLKTTLSSKQKQKNGNAQIKKEDRNEISSQQKRRNTFIASLNGLSQIQQRKMTSKEILTSDSPQPVQRTPQPVQRTPQSVQRTPQSDYEYYSNTQQNQSKRTQKSSVFITKPIGYRITLDGSKIPLPNQRAKDILLNKDKNKESRVSKMSQLSINSIKNQEDGEFAKRNQNDSSHTTDYQDEIINKIKQDLGLNFNYYNKK